MMNIDTQAVRAEPHVEIGTLLQHQADEIVDRWCRVAREEEGAAAKRAHHMVLRDELPDFIRGMGRALKRSGVAEAEPQRRAAKEHGTQRWDSGWSLSELVRDYQIMRVVILDFLEENLRRPLYYREAMAVGVFIDDAIAASITRYVAHREAHIEQTERERSETLKDLSRRKDEFLAILGHELRNPLAPIRNSLTVLRKLVASDHPAVATSLDVLDRQSQQLGRLVDDLLDLARISRGEFELRKSQIDLRTPVEQALQMTDELIVKRGHKLHLSICTVPLLLDADSQRVAQIAANLLNNAAKYTEPGGNIWLSVAREGDSAVIRVRDDGIGIAPEMLSRVFELFARVEGSQASGREGLGIGLALVQRLVHQHGGVIAAQSDGIGRGSEFVVRLPVAAAATAPGGAAADGLKPLLVITAVPVDKA
jgi:signal transduction histidine kinase